MKILSAILVTLALVIPSITQATPITTNCFTQCSFADVVINYNPGPGVGPLFDNAENSLGAPNAASFIDYTSLGLMGSITVQFTNNALTTSGNDIADLFVFEDGNTADLVHVSISTTGKEWIPLGVFYGQPIKIDIDSIGNVVPDEKYYYVHIRDMLFGMQSEFPYAGADIDAIGSRSYERCILNPIPIPSTMFLLAAGLAGLALRRSTR